MSTDKQPSPSGENGRTPAGTFSKGNKLGRGNPHHVQAAKLRSTPLLAVSPDDLLAVVTAMVARAKAGEPWAIRELLDRCLGRTRPAEDDIAGDGKLTIIVRHVDRSIDSDA